MILLSLVPQSWITACGPAPSCHWVLGAELRSSCLLGKANTLLTKPSPQPQERLSEGDFRYCYFWKQGIGWAEILSFNLVLINEFIRVIPVQRCCYNYSQGDWNLLANIRLSSNVYQFLLLGDRHGVHSVLSSKHLVLRFFYISWLYQVLEHLTVS